MKKVLKNSKGLTLIELLAVIVILGIIVAIAIPAIGSAISDSEEQSEVNDAIRIIDAAKLYVASGGEIDSDGVGYNDLKGDYLDRVDPDARDFKVKEAENGNGNGYQICDHPVSSDCISEQELLGED